MTVKNLEIVYYLTLIQIAHIAFIPHKFKRPTPSWSFRKLKVKLISTNSYSFYSRYKSFNDCISDVVIPSSLTAYFSIEPNSSMIESYDAAINSGLVSINDNK